LDPAGIAEIRQLIRELAKEGKTIVLASHLLDEVEKICSHVAILQKGELITAGHVNEVLVEEDLLEAGAADLAALDAIAQRFPGVKRVLRGDQTISVFLTNGSADLGQFNQFCFENGIILNHLLLRKRSLESKFIELTNNATN
jgi:ABC-2 type transport system ATP-binding protein